MRTLLFALAALLVQAAPPAQHAIVQKKANLRATRSLSSSPVKVLLPDDEVTVLDATTSTTFVQVKTDDGKTGWVSAKAVKLVPGDGPSNPSGPASSAISPDWEKPAPVTKDFENAEGTCPADGAAGDTPTSHRKNRIDPLPTPHDVSWAAINALPYPAAKPMRKNWSASELAVIAPFEGVAVRVTGFLSHAVKVESDSSGEATNCHAHDPPDVDWHIYFVENVGDGVEKAIIAETTPRVRANHKWEQAVLQKWVGKNQPVRFSGFLMVDPEHRNVVGKERGTVWEIHPLTKIEVCNSATCSDSDWIDLDTLSP